MGDFVQKLNEIRGKISLCMIVKDEEAMLPGMLDSARGAWDELIAVDTGSKDRTVEILESEEAKILRRPWADSFSLHRNQAQEEATGDWILILDADERLGQGGVEGIRNATKIDKDMWIFQVFSYTGGGRHKSYGTSPRLFRNNLGIHWKGAVHNQLQFDPNLRAAYTDIELHHLGYDLSPEQMKVKRERSYRLMYKALEDDPKDYAMWHHLGITLLADKRWKEAEHAAEMALSLVEKIGNAQGWTSFVSSYADLRSNNNERALEKALRWLCEFPWQIDLYYVAALAAAALKQWRKAVEYAEGYFEQRERLANRQTNYGFYHFETVGRADQIKGLMMKTQALTNPQAMVSNLL